jgi:nitrite reductase/ring-hydroxylating ferredoxin subunit
MAELFVAKKSAVTNGERVLLELDGFEIGVYRHNDTFYAYRNVCLHQGGPVCAGVTMGRVDDIIAADRTYVRQSFDASDPHIICPWHGYEYRLLTGECAADPRLRLQRFDIVERNGDVYVVV